MPLAPGESLGPYEVLSLIGAGGMGEVYRARDTQLKRDVALKVLPEELAADRDRLGRFDREAQALAALNHPHIAQVYGVSREGSVRPIVMELVAGEDLAARILRGPVAVDDALPIARQLAEALQAAHEAGIIHRDLKPANIKVTPDGVVDQPRHDPRRHHSGHSRLHVTRAGARPRRGQARGHLGVRRRPVRDADRRRLLRWRDDHRRAGGRRHIGPGLEDAGVTVAADQTQSVILSPSRDGKSLLTSVRRDKTDIWILDGFDTPRGGFDWWKRRN
jgi:serine/threonine protein kinase